MSNETYSVKGVAERIAFRGDADEVRKIIRQVRHWTNADLLTPVGEKHTGTGVSRQYDADEVRKAALLLELSRYGVTVEMLENFDEWTDSLKRTDAWKKAAAGKGDYFLQMAWEPGEDGGTIWRPNISRGLLVSKEMSKRHNFSLASTIIINVAAVFQRIRL